MGLFALRALARRAEFPPIFKDETALQTPGRLKDKAKWRANAFLHMVQVVQHLLHLQMHLGRQFVQCEEVFREKFHESLAMGKHVRAIPVRGAVSPGSRPSRALL